MQNGPAPKILPAKQQIGFAVGDFGCNLYWQSLTFFLLYYYTDVVGIEPAQAGLLYMIASVFDGCIDPIAGAIIDRTRTRWGRYRPWLIAAALPLACAFTFLYYKPAAKGSALFLMLLVSHLLFRACYTAAAVPYAALTARLTTDSRTRTNLAGLRTLFSALAGAVIAFAMQPLITILGRGEPSRGFFLAAAVIGCIATIAFLIAFGSTREPADMPEDAGAHRLDFAAILQNKAFLTLAIALVFASCSSTALSKSIIYYFKYVVGREDQARIALFSSSIVSLIMLPVWMIVARRIGKRLTWLGAVSIGLFGLLIFLINRPTSVIGATLFFDWMQVVTDGIAMAYWSMLPDTVEYGEHASGKRHESVLFGLFMFFQKAGLGAAAALFGFALGQAGYSVHAPMSAATVGAIGPIIAALSGLGLAGSGLVIFFSPLRRGVHEAIVDSLTRARNASHEEGDTHLGL